MNTSSRNVLVAIVLVIVGALVMFLFFRWVVAQQDDKPANNQEQSSVQGANTEEKDGLTDNNAEYPVQTYFIVPQTGGEEACANTPRSAIYNTQSKDLTRAALEKLFAIKTQYYGNNKLYNALWESNLAIESITNKDNRVVIALNGTFKLEGTCDPAFAEVQITQTAGVAARQQYGQDDEAVEITVGGKPLYEALGLTRH
jgi:hypothetical protein